MAQAEPLFGICIAGCPIITAPSSIPSPTSITFNLPARNFSHVVVFMLPGIVLPPGTAAAVYIAAENGFKFLGGVGSGKESAIFKIAGLRGSRAVAPGSGTNMDLMQDNQLPIASQSAVIGISIEPATVVEAQMASLQAASAEDASTDSTVEAGETSTSLVVRNQQHPEVLKLAQKIIKNAFNFLASFSGNVNGGVEVVPLKAFEDWWKKFEGRIRSDPGFLERDSD